MATTPVVIPDPNAAAALQTPVAPPADPSAAPPSQPAAAPVTENWFLEAPSGTRYRTLDDAVAGVAEKDATIARLKQQVAQGQQALGSAPQAVPQPTLVDILEQAISTGNKALVDQALDQMVQAKMQSFMQPMQPIIQHSTLNRAVEVAALSDPNIPAFVKSDAFRQVAKDFPVLGEAIQNAQLNPVYAEQQLPQILQIARLAALARTAAPAAAPAPPAQRPTPPSTTPATPVAATAATNKDALYDLFSQVSPEDWRAANALPRR